MTAEEAEVLRRANAIVAKLLEQPLTSAPMKVDCTEMRCHPDDFDEVKAAFDAPIVLDPTVKPGRLQVVYVQIVPLAKVDVIAASVGFAGSR